MDFNQEKSEVSILDRNISKLFYYKLKDIIQNQYDEIRQIKIAPEASRVIQKNDSLFFCIGIFSNGGMFGKSVNGKIEQTYFEFPDIKNENLNSTQKFMLFQGEMKMNPDCTKFAYISKRCDLLKIVSMENDILQEIATVYTYFPKFRKAPDDMIIIERENQNGFLSISTTREYIFALFSGRNEANSGSRNYFGDIVRVFDWNGNLAKEVVLDKDAWQIYVDEKSNKLYTIHYEEKESDYQISYLGYNIEEFCLTND